MANSNPTNYSFISLETGEKFQFQELETKVTAILGTPPDLANFPPPPPQALPFANRFASLKEQCAARGLSFSTFQKRRASGLGIDEALSRPVKDNRKRPAKREALAADERFYESTTPCPSCRGTKRYAKSGGCANRCR